MVTSKAFGKTKNGEEVTAYTITNKKGSNATILDYGATIVSVNVSDGEGNLKDVVLGYDTIEEYQNQGGHLGGTIGRMGNRLGGAKFTLNGKEYKLCANDGKNHLHGGKIGFDKRMWQGFVENDRVKFSLFSPHMEEGYPGNLNVSVTFSLSDNDEFSLEYSAKADMDTIVNLTNHVYFNLNGSGSILDHEVMLNAYKMTLNNREGMTVNEIRDVVDTPFDFTSFKRIGQDIEADCEQIKFGRGYDINLIPASSFVGSLRSRESKIQMDIISDMPGVQLYTGNFLTKRKGKKGGEIDYRGGVCFETQLYPNAMNCYGFPSPILHAGECMNSKTTYRFGLMK